MIHLTNRKWYINSLYHSIQCLSVTFYSALLRHLYDFSFWFNLWTNDVIQAIFASAELSCVTKTTTCTWINLFFIFRMTNKKFRYNFENLYDSIQIEFGVLPNVRQKQLCLSKDICRWILINKMADIEQIIESLVL